MPRPRKVINPKRTNLNLSEETRKKGFTLAREKGQSLSEFISLLISRAWNHRKK